MNTLQVVLLLAAGLSVAHSLDYKALNQFRRMILCLMPDSWPVLDYADYGCYCGKGGSGTPVDDLDRCCQVHDQCYSDAMQHPECWPITDNPYTEFYDYSCDEINKKVTCGKENNECEMFICECDRKAAECFSVSPWNPEHEHLPSDRSPAPPLFALSGSLFVIPAVAAACWISLQATVQRALSISTVSTSSWWLAGSQLWLLLAPR